MPRTLFIVLLSSVVLIACEGSAAPSLPCADPAPLEGQFDPRAPAYIVVFESGVSARQETDRLAAEYGFTPRFIWEVALQGFSAELTSEVVAAIRCEGSVQYMAHDGVVSIDR